MGKNKGKKKNPSLTVVTSTPKLTPAAADGGTSLSPITFSPLVATKTAQSAADLPPAPANSKRLPGTSAATHNEIVVITDEELSPHEDDESRGDYVGNCSVDSSSCDSVTKYSRAEATLRTIEESLADIKELLRNGDYISAREVSTLRSSLVYLLTDCRKLAKSELGQACLNDLRDVELSVLSQDALTGDSESLTPLGFGENMEPILAKTVNRLEAKRAAERAAKKSSSMAKKAEIAKQASGPNSSNIKNNGGPSSPKTADPKTAKPTFTEESTRKTPAAVSSTAKPQPNTTDGTAKQQAPASTANVSKEAPPSKPSPSPQKESKPPAWQFVNIPPRRRLQTLVMSFLLFFTAVPAAIFLSIILLIIPFTMPFMVAYIVYMVYDNKFAKKHPLKPWKPWTQSTFLQIYKDYFPCRLSIPRDYRPKFDRKKNYMFIYHPHGVHSFGVVCCFGADVHNIGSMIPGIKIHAQTLAINFWIPFWRQLTIWGGCGDASAHCIRKTLRSGPGESIALVVGGAEESLLSSPKTNILCLNKRKGFVKIALETGSPLVPVFGFGETNVYYNFAHGSPLLRRILLGIQKRLGFAIPLISGRGYFNYNWGIFPHRRPIIVVVGEPLADMPQIPHPTREDVDFWHAKYIEALKAHYEKHKAVYDVEGTLVIE